MSRGRWGSAYHDRRWIEYQAELDVLVASAGPRCGAALREHVCDETPEHSAAHQCRCGFSWFPFSE